MGSKTLHTGPATLQPPTPSPSPRRLFLVDAGLALGLCSTVSSAARIVHHFPSSPGRVSFLPGPHPGGSPLHPLWVQHGDTQAEPGLAWIWGVGHLGSPIQSKSGACALLCPQSSSTASLPSPVPQSRSQWPRDTLIPLRDLESSPLLHI